MDENLTLVGNYAVAGTEKFLTHALKFDDPEWITYCGLHLKYHRNQQWEITDGNELTTAARQPSCLKCQRSMKAQRRGVNESNR